MSVVAGAGSSPFLSVWQLFSGNNIAGPYTVGGPFTANGSATFAGPVVDNGAFTAGPGAMNLNNTGVSNAAINIGTSASYTGNINIGTNANAPILLSNTAGSLTANGNISLGPSNTNLNTITIGNAAGPCTATVAGPFAVTGQGSSFTNAITPAAAGGATLGTSSLPWSSIVLGASAMTYSTKVVRQVTLTQSQVTGAFATPVQLIAAPGAGFAIFINQVQLNYLAGTNAFAAGGVLVIQYGNTVNGGGTSATNGTNSGAATFLTSGVANLAMTQVGMNNASNGTLLPTRVLVPECRCIKVPVWRHPLSKTKAFSSAIRRRRSRTQAVERIS